MSIFGKVQEDRCNLQCNLQISQSSHRYHLKDLVHELVEVSTSCSGAGCPCSGFSCVQRPSRSWSLSIQKTVRASLVFAWNIRPPTEGLQRNKTAVASSDGGLLRISSSSALCLHATIYRYIVGELRTVKRPQPPHTRQLLVTN